uniref:Uncharacterized protein n=1 Tax=Glossina pallidipes TaxID=7398 RepID=A0A1A9ZFL0_GLOPL
MLRCATSMTRKPRWSQQPNIISTYVLKIVSFQLSILLPAIVKHSKYYVLFAGNILGRLESKRRSELRRYGVERKNRINEEGIKSERGMKPNAECCKDNKAMSGSSYSPYGERSYTNGACGSKTQKTISCRIFILVLFNVYGLNTQNDLDRLE